MEEDFEKFLLETFINVPVRMLGLAIKSGIENPRVNCWKDIIDGAGANYVARAQLTAMAFSDFRETQRTKQDTENSKRNEETATKIAKSNLFLARLGIIVVVILGVLPRPIEFVEHKIYNKSVEVYEMVKENVQR